MKKHNIYRKISLLCSLGIGGILLVLLYFSKAGIIDTIGRFGVISIVLFYGAFVVLFLPLILTVVKVRKGLIFFPKKQVLRIDGELLVIEKKESSKEKSLRSIVEAHLFRDPEPSIGYFLSERMVLSFEDGTYVTIATKAVGYDDLEKWLREHKVKIQDGNRDLTN